MLRPMVDVEEQEACWETRPIAWGLFISLIDWQFFLSSHRTIPYYVSPLHRLRRSRSAWMLANALQMSCAQRGLATKLTLLAD